MEIIVILVNCVVPQEFFFMAIFKKVCSDVDHYIMGKSRDFPDFPLFNNFVLIKLCNDKDFPGFPGEYCYYNPIMNIISS